MSITAYRNLNTKEEVLVRKDQDGYFVVIRDSKGQKNIERINAKTDSEADERGREIWNRIKGVLGFTLNEFAKMISVSLSEVSKAVLDGKIKTCMQKERTLISYLEAKRIQKQNAKVLTIKELGQKLGPQANGKNLDKVIKEMVGMDLIKPCKSFFDKDGVAASDLEAVKNFIQAK